MDLGLSGKACTVLGGTRGIGLQTVRILAEEGAKIAVISRDSMAMRSEFDLLAARCGVEIITLSADAASPGEVEGAIGTAIDHFGGIWGLAITNHWIGRSRTFEDTDDSEWELYFQHSLMGAVRAARTALPQMAKAGEGSLVITSAYSARAPKPFIPAYAAFKAALVNLVKSLAKTYGPDGVRVNAAAPGAIRTGRYEQRLDDMRKERPDLEIAQAEHEMLERMGMRPALGRIGDPSEVADLIVFLLSQRAAYTTGLIANIDGGTDF